MSWLVRVHHGLGGPGTSNVKLPPFVKANPHTLSFMCAAVRTYLLFVLSRQVTEAVQRAIANILFVTLSTPDCIFENSFLQALMFWRRKHFAFTECNVVGQVWTMACHLCPLHTSLYFRKWAASLINYQLLCVTLLSYKDVRLFFHAIGNWS